MKLYTQIIKYRFYIGIILLVAAILVNIKTDFWPSFILYFLGFLCIVTHFIIGPLRLIQGHMEEGDFEGASKVLDSVWFPNLLLKPIRSTYYQLKSYIAMSQKDNDAAEKHMRKSLSLGVPMKEAEGASHLQLGSLAMQRGDMKQGEEHIRLALKLGLPDKESQAMAHMQLVGAYINRRQYKAGKEHFKKAKACNPKTPELVNQIKMMESQITRLPG
jgi:tetratricopeptide (TPR) repeat protein